MIPHHDEGITSKVDLIELLKSARDMAFSKAAGRKDQMTAFCVLVGGSGERALVEVPIRGDVERTAFMFHALNELMHDSGTIAYAFVGEVRSIPTAQLHEPPLRPESATEEVALSFRGSSSPHSRNMLVVLVSDGFNTHTRLWQVRRGPKGAVTSLEECKEGMSEVSEPLTELLRGGLRLLN
jgi:hypothetical protein